MHQHGCRCQHDASALLADVDTGLRGELRVPSLVWGGLLLRGFAKLAWQLTCPLRFLALTLSPMGPCCTTFVGAMLRSHSIYPPGSQRASHPLCACYPRWTHPDTCAHSQAARAPPTSAAPVMHKAHPLELRL